MARILKEKEYNERRNEILDVVQRLIYTKGYQAMAIQDILDALQISKGGFYHYFESKQSLLEALLERTQESAEQILVPIVKDESLSALEKLHLYFSSVSQWKAGQKPYMIALLRIWYTDENAIVRQKTLAAVRNHMVPLLDYIIRQGIREGTFHPAFPDQAADLLMTILPGMGDSFAMVLLDHRPTEEDLIRVTAVVAAYTDAIERVLGLPQETIHLIEPGDLAEWLLPVSNEISEENQAGSISPQPVDTVS